MSDEKAQEEAYALLLVCSLGSGSTGCGNDKLTSQATGQNCFMDFWIPSLVFYDHSHKVVGVPHYAPSEAG